MCKRVSSHCISRPFLTCAILNFCSDGKILPQKLSQDWKNGRIFLWDNFLSLCNTIFRLIHLHSSLLQTSCFSLNPALPFQPIANFKLLWKFHLLLCFVAWKNCQWFWSNLGRLHPEILDTFDSRLAVQNTCCTLSGSCSKRPKYSPSKCAFKMEMLSLLRHHKCHNFIPPPLPPITNTRRLKQHAPLATLHSHRMSSNSFP